MNTLVLLLKRDSMWLPETWAIQHGGKRNVAGQVIIENQLGWLSVLRDDLILNEYDDEERSELSVILTDPMPFLLEWKGCDLIEALLRAVPLESSAVVDNDHGLLIPIQAIRDLPFESWVKENKLL